MLDKRAIMRDQRVARMGLSRRIRLRIRPASSTPVASVDPLSGAATPPSQDTFEYMTAQFNLLKATLDYDSAGAIQQERAVLYFHLKYKAWVEQSYSMYVGATGKEWTKISPVTFDDARSMLKVIVEATQ